jgi:membrane-associated phospholipid phosphatase
MPANAPNGWTAGPAFLRADALGMIAGWDPSSDTVYRFFHLITHLGDSALLVPLSMAVIGVLIWSGHKPAALRFGMAVGTFMLAIVVLKIAFYAIGGDAYLNVLSPSGHAGFSVTVFGCCAAILAKQLRSIGAIAVVAAAIALTATVLASRIFLGAHTPEEVVIGTVMGCLCVATFLFWNPDLERVRLRLPLSVALALMLGTASVWAAGRHFDTERRIEQAGILVGSSLGTLSSSDLIGGLGNATWVKRLDNATRR